MPVPECLNAAFQRFSLGGPPSAVGKLVCGADCPRRSIFCALTQLRLPRAPDTVEWFWTGNIAPFRYGTVPNRRLGWTNHLTNRMDERHVYIWH